MKSYLNDRKQIVSVSNQVSTAKYINIGTPQGSRLSPLLFIILMADLDLWTEKSMLSNFADDTQSIVIHNNNNLVNNPDKAAILYNSKGTGSEIIVENIGKENLKSSYSEKLLGLHINSDFGWNTHVEKISIELKQRIGLLKRIRQRIPRKKLIIIAEAIFNTKIRYGIAVYLSPVFDKEDLKVEKLSKNASILQSLQNKMIRIILGCRKEQHVNMQKLRNRIRMMSVNQMNIYHTLLEAHIITRNFSSEQIRVKWDIDNENKYMSRRSFKTYLKVPQKPSPKCINFSYVGAKLFNMLPDNIRETSKSSIFKNLIKDWIWNHIPSY